MEWSITFIHVLREFVLRAERYALTVVIYEYRAMIALIEVVLGAARAVREVGRHTVGRR